jgi:hypothetical protein
LAGVDMNLSAFQQHGWKVKLPLRVFIAHALISLPFYFGFIRTSFHQDNLYSLCYYILNRPILWMLFPIFGKIERRLPDIIFYNEDIVTPIILTATWTFIAFVVAMIIDKRSEKR